MKNEKVSKEIQDLLIKDKFDTSIHFLSQMRKRGLKEVLDDKVLGRVIIEGELIEQIRMYGNGEKNLVHCEYKGEKFHISLHYKKNSSIIIVTIYRQDGTFEEDFKTRKPKKRN